MISQLITSGALILLASNGFSQNIPLQKNIQELVLKAQDGTEIAITETNQQKETIIIICHGIIQYKDAPIMRQIAAEFIDSYDVINMDMRGHGKSKGKCTLGALEPQDLKVVVDYARQNHKKVGVIGFSLGAAATVVEAAKYKNIDSLILISPFARVREVNIKFWRKEAFMSLEKNLKDKKRKVKIGNIFLPRQDPIDVIAQVSPIPVLFIHSTKDWVIDINHSQRLYKKAKEPKELLILESSQHAEHIYDQLPQRLINACKDWFSKTL